MIPVHEPTLSALASEWHFVASEIFAIILILLTFKFTYNQLIQIYVAKTRNDMTKKAFQNSRYAHE